MQCRQALRLRVSVMNINKLQKACIFISADPRPTDSVQGLSGSMVVVLSSRRGVRAHGGSREVRQLPQF